MAGVTYKTCPRRPLLDDPVSFNELFRLYRGYLDGYLPDEGSLTSQSHSLMVLFDVIGAAVAEAQAIIDKTAEETRKLNELKSKQGNG